MQMTLKGKEILMLFSDYNVELNMDGGVLTAYIKGEVDHHNAKAARRRIDREMEERCPTELVLDLGGVNFMDSSGLGLILGRYNKATELGIPFSVKNPTPATMKIISLAGGERIINIIK